MNVYGLDVDVVVAALVYHATRDIQERKKWQAEAQAEAQDLLHITCATAMNLGHKLLQLLKKPQKTPVEIFIVIKVRLKRD